jgi:hypothetical protein
MPESILESSLDKEVYLEAQSSFMGTPLWESDSELKYSHTSSLKKYLHRPDTPYSLGKVIELSLGEWEPPKLIIILNPQSQEDPADFKIKVNPLLSLYQDLAKGLLLIYPKTSSSVTGELMEEALKVGLKYWIRVNGPLEVLEVLDWNLEILLGYLRGDESHALLTYERGIELEGLLEDN